MTPLPTLLLPVLLLFAFAGPAAAQAQDDGVRDRLGGDLYAAGREVRIAGSDITDVFAAGETVSIDSPIARSLHAAGARIRVSHPVGGSFYGGGYGIDVDAAIGGDMTAAGYRIEIGADGAVQGTARLAGRRIEIRGPVHGNANLAGETVEIAAPIAGAVDIRADRIRFAAGARIDGRLRYWSRQAVEIPPGVIAPDRVAGHTLVMPSGHRLRSAGIFGLIFGGLAFALVLLALAAAFAWIFPGLLLRTRESLGRRPWWSLLLGLVVVSGLIGAIPVLAASVIGIPLVPMVAGLAPLLLFAAYLTSAHALGRWLLGRLRITPGAGGLAAFIAMVTGALALALVGLVPVFGWVVAVLAVLAGAGAWLGLWLAPATARPA